MPAKLLIQDGNPVWLSASIVPSKDTVISPGSSPVLATIQVNSADVFVYVKVENTGTVDLGACSCTGGGAWPGPAPFQGFLDDVNGAVTPPAQAGVTFSASPAGDKLSGAAGISWPAFGFPATGRRAWAWSPDGRFFGYVSSPIDNDWGLTIVALQNVTRSNGSAILKGQIAVTASGAFDSSNPAQFWTNASFGWAASKAVFASGTHVTGSGLAVCLACPEAPSGTAWKNVFSTVPAVLVSRCGSIVAFAPRVAMQAFLPVSTATALPTQFRANNAPISISSTGAGVSITTNTHTANGVTVNTGNGTTVTIDDPDCAVVGGGITARVDRVKASTLPTANLGVLPIGSAVIGTLAAGNNAWVQVPNQNGWANQSERHWCLLAQAYTVDGITVPRPWDGQATNPPPFPTATDNCAQRNIHIDP